MNEVPMFSLQKYFNTRFLYKTNFIWSCYKSSFKTCEYWKLGCCRSENDWLFCKVLKKKYTGWVKKVWFFLVFQWPKRKSVNFFFSQKKVQKSKNVYINYFYRNLKYFNDWIKESQKIRKIVKSIKFSSSFLLIIV